MIAAFTVVAAIGTVLTVLGLAAVVLLGNRKGSVESTERERSSLRRRSLLQMTRARSAPR